MKQFIMTVAAFAVSAPVLAQDSAPEPAPAPAPPPPCESEFHDDFDFWVGRWDVTPAGREEPTAVNIIKKVHNGCALFENYTTAGGYTGMSLNAYDARKGKWHQTWIGADGTPLYLEGGLNAAGQMVLSDKGLVPGQAEGSWSEISWTPNEDGSVRQLWRSTTDSGETWNVVFDGRYVRQADPKIQN